MGCIWSGVSRKYLICLQTLIGIASRYAFEADHRCVGDRGRFTAVAPGLIVAAFEEGKSPSTGISAPGPPSIDDPKVRLAPEMLQP